MEDLFSSSGLTVKTNVELEKVLDFDCIVSCGGHLRDLIPVAYGAESGTRTHTRHNVLFLNIRDLSIL